MRRRHGEITSILLMDKVDPDGVNWKLCNIICT